MTKRKNFILGAGLAIASTTVVLAVSCGSAGSQLSKLSKERIFRRFINTTYVKSALPYDSSWSYGNPTSSLQISTDVRLISVRNIGQPKFQTEGTIDPTTGTTTNSASKILEPSVWSYYLNGADAVVLTLKDGKTETFDSDEAEIQPKPTIDGKYFTLSSERATSANPKSINSKAFDDALKNTKKMSFRVRQNIAWVDNNGKKTGFTMDGNDYYIGYMRTRLYDTKFRRANGGSKALDDEMVSMLESPGDSFGESANYGNEYLLNLNGIDVSKILNRNDFVTKDGNRDFVNFNADPKNPNNNFDLMFQGVSASNEWAPAPSEYIKSLIDKKEEKIIPQKPLNAAAIEKIKTNVEKATGIAKETGIYWYGTNFGNTLSAGKYYFHQYNTVTNTLEVLRNENYWDKKFLDDKTTVLRFEDKYQIKPLDPAVFDTLTFNSYRDGDVSSFAFSSQPSNNQAVIKKSPEIYGLTLIQSEIKNNLINRVRWRFIPTNTTGAFKNADPLTNDVFEKLMWGSSNSSDIVNGTINGAEAVKASTSGFGLSFRSILTAALNWNYISSISVNVPVRPWLTGLAPDNLLGGSNQETSKFKTPRDAYDQFNTLYAVDFNGKKIDLSASKGVSNSEITTKNNIDILPSSGETDKSKSAGYQELKAAMKTLLDKFYAENPTFKDKKVKFGIPSRFTNLSDRALTGQREAVKLINSLDPRIDAEYDYVTTSQDWNQKWNQGRTAFKLDGWGYDYNGIGTGFDGISFSLGLFPILGIITTDQKYREELQKSYPAVVKAAEDFKAFVDKQYKNLSIPISEWPKLTSDQLFNLKSTLGSQEYKDGKLVPITDPSKRHEDGATISAKFWLNFQITHTNEQLIEFAKELINFLGVPINATTAIAESAFTETVSNPNYSIPVSFNAWSPLSDIKIATKK